MLISISGTIGSGKDTIAKIISSLDCYHNQYFNKLSRYDGLDDISFTEHILTSASSVEMDKVINESSWINKKFAGKLKQIAAILFDCNEKDLEDINFKNSALPKEWQSSEIHAQSPLTYRFALQTIGTELFRERWNQNTWVISALGGYKPKERPYPTGNYCNICSHCGKEIFMCEKYCRCCQDCWEKANYPNWIFTDARFLNEINAIKSVGGITIKLTRGEKTTSTHLSEIEFEQYSDWDFIIYNNKDFQHLIQQVKDLMIQLSLLHVETNRN